MNLKAFKSRSEMGVAAGKAVEKKILEMLREKDALRIIFAAAPSQADMLEYLRNSSSIPWEKITAFHMDEYIGLSPESPALFSNFLRNHLFDHLLFHKVHLLDGNQPTEKEAERYASLLSESPIDLVCLGIGENGHIAFNDPPVADFNDAKLVKKVSLDLACRQQQVNDDCFENISEVPLEALTLTIPCLINAAYLCCVVPGENKKNAVYETLLGKLDTTCPASILRSIDQCDLFLDSESYPMALEGEVDANNFVVKDCISGQHLLLHLWENELISKVELPDDHSNGDQFIGPGLVDLQINGINGVDFNDTSLTAVDVLEATKYLISLGVTSFYPTLITNEDSSILQLIKTMVEACNKYPLVEACMAGIHLEGPFISPEDGARGAHGRQFIKPPSWPLIQKYQNTSGQRIKLLTLAPEWEGAVALIENCRKSGIKLAIGHSLANMSEIHQAVEAGAALSTHLGNGIPLMLQRHPNPIWDQLSEDGLYISLIADGFHLPDSFLKVAIKVKGEKAILVSDATGFSGMAPGVYHSHIGNEVELSPEGKLSVKGSDGILAGASKNLLENVNYLLKSRIRDLSQAWSMASVFPNRLMEVDEIKFPRTDLVRFLFEGNQIRVLQVYKKGILHFDLNGNTITTWL
ncbi:MAG: 6-phosphogluconolactonase [Cyclobacteriaceae bacterium]